MGKKSRKAFRQQMVATSQKVENPQILENASGIGGGQAWDNFFPQNQGTGYSTQISNVTTSFINLRNYLVSNFWQFLSEAYVELGLVQSIVDIPVDDALRGGITVKSDELDEDQIKQLTNSVDRDDDLTTAGQAEKWNRLYGGAAIIVFTNQDPITPLKISILNKNSELEFRAADMWELTWDKQNTEGYDPTTQQEDFEYYTYYGEKVHKSRVMRLKGTVAPSYIRPRLRGWGFSVVETLIRSMNQYLKATDVLFEVIDEFKLDIYLIKNYMSALFNEDSLKKVDRRIRHTNYTKNYQNAIVMDSEDKYEQKQLSFAGMADTLQEIRMQVAADMRMPMIKLFGTPAKGLGATDESSIEVYNSMVESQVRNRLKYPILRILEIKCQVLFGFVPKDLSMEFQPLKMMSAEQQENVKTQKFSRLIQARQMGELSPIEFRDACNKGNLFDISLDPNNVYATGYDQDQITEGRNNPDNPQDTDNPGADRADTRKARADDTGGAPKGGTMKNEEERLKPYGKRDRVLRVLFNSAEFDKASYAADDGDNWIDPRRAEFFKNPLDLELWKRAKAASLASQGEEKWQFIVWWYTKQGGKFH